MKRFILMLLAIGALGVVFAGCKKDDEKAEETPKTTEETTGEVTDEPKEEATEEAADEGEGEEVAASGDADTGIEECDSYIATFERYMNCDAVPEQAREATKQGLEQMKQGWAQLKDPNIPAEAKAAAGDGCKQAEDALKETASTLGCEL